MILAGFRRRGDRRHRFTGNSRTEQPVNGISGRASGGICRNRALKKSGGRWGRSQARSNADGELSLVVITVPKIFGNRFSCRGLAVARLDWVEAACGCEASGHAVELLKPDSSLAAGSFR